MATITTSEHDFKKVAKAWSVFCGKFSNYIISREDCQSSEDVKKSMLLFAAGPELDTAKTFAYSYGVNLSTLEIILEFIEEKCLLSLIILFERFRRHFDREESITSGSSEAFTHAWSDLLEYGKLKNLVYGSENNLSGKSETSEKSVVKSLRKRRQLSHESSVKEEPSTDISDNDDDSCEKDNIDEMDNDSGDKQRMLEAQRSNHSVKITTSTSVETCESVMPAKFHCHMCYHPFLSLTDLENHSQKEHQLLESGPAKNYTCALCLHKTKKLPSLISHVGQKHKRSKNRLCRHCGEFFKSVKICEDHVKEHHQEQLKCQQNKALKEKRDKVKKSPLEDTEKEKELEIQGFQCQLCGWRFPLRGSLQNHIVRKHYAEKDQMCRFCGQYFEDPSECKSHVRAHRTDRKKKPDFCCGVCNMSFLLQDCLLSHITQSHLAEKDQMCSYCGKYFKTAKKCIEHIKWHEHSKTAQADQTQNEPEEEIEEMLEKTSGDDKTEEMEKNDEQGEEVEEEEVEEKEGGLNMTDGIETDSLHTCQMCGQGFKLLASMQSHILRKHYEERDHLCRYCGSYFEDIYECVKHVREHIAQNRKLRVRLKNPKKTGPKAGKVRCGFCGSYFKSVSGFRSHRYRDHYSEKERICSHCGKYFKTKEEINKHKRLHAEKKMFSTVHKMPALTPSLPGENQVECQLCKKVLRGRFGMETHIRRKHPGEKRKMCRYCGKHFNSTDKCSAHIKKHLIERKEFRKTGVVLKLTEKDFSSALGGSDDQTEESHKAKCQPCGKEYLLASSLRRHILQMHNQIQDRLCHHCGLEFEDAMSCKEHMKSHSLANRYQLSTENDQNQDELDAREESSVSADEDDEEENSKASSSIDSFTNSSAKQKREGFKKCDLCGSVLGSRKSMLSHIKSIHGELQDHLCACCGKYFENPADCVRHQRPQVRKKIACDFCPRTFKTQFLRDNHMKRHKNQRDLQCDICGNCYFDRKGLNAHRMRHKNAKQATFQCTKCDRVLSSKNSLKHHMRVHNNDRPYICEVCGKGFTQYTTMKIHRNIHTDVKPFECEICGKKARTKADLSRHMPLHSNKREHVCDICGKAYRFQSGLFSHRAVHSGLRPYVCKLCGCSYRTSQSLRKHSKTHAPGAKTKGTTVPRVPLPVVEGSNSTTKADVQHVQQVANQDLSASNPEALAEQLQQQQQHHQQHQQQHDALADPIPTVLHERPSAIAQNDQISVLHQQQQPPASQPPLPQQQTMEMTRPFSDHSMVTLPHAVPNQYNITGIPPPPRMAPSITYTSHVMTPLVRGGPGTYSQGAMVGMQRPTHSAYPQVTHPAVMPRGPHGPYSNDEMAVVVALQVLDDISASVQQEHHG